MKTEAREGRENGYRWGETRGEGLRGTIEEKKERKEITSRLWTESEEWGDRSGERKPEV